MAPAGGRRGPRGSLEARHSAEDAALAVAVAAVDGSVCDLEGGRRGVEQPAHVRHARVEAEVGIQLEIVIVHGEQGHSQQVVREEGARVESVLEGELHAVARRVGTAGGEGAWHRTGESNPRRQHVQLDVRAAPWDGKTRCLAMWSAADPRAAALTSAGCR